MGQQQQKSIIYNLSQEDWDTIERPNRINVDIVQQRKMISQHSEERRQQVSQFSFKYESIIGQLCVKYENNSKSLGTGTLVIIQNQFCVLTVAHTFLNIYQRDQKTFEVQSSAIKFYYKKISPEDQFHYVGQSTRVNKEYLNPSTCEGYDIGLISLNIDRDKLEDDSAYQLKEEQQFENLDVKVGETIWVIGYPSENELEGKIYKMSGNIQQIQKLKNGTILLHYKNIDTSPGQSGSPIILQRNNEFILIGVHNGYDDFYESNFGTALSQQQMNWIFEKLKIEEQYHQIESLKKLKKFKLKQQKNMEIKNLKIILKCTSFQISFIQFLFFKSILVKQYHKKI